MSERNITFKNIWKVASFGGVVLAFVSIVFMLQEMLFMKYQFTGNGFLSFICKIGKIVLCIWLMYKFMSYFKETFTQAGRSDIRRCGIWIAILSAFVFAGANMIYLRYNYALTAEIFEMMMKNMGGRLDANSINAIETMKESFPEISFITTFIYCVIYGWIVSAILAPRIAIDDPFATENPEDGQNDGGEK